MSGTIFSINSNISSFRAQRQLSTATKAHAASLERLSSGLRINSASDDAAGLAVASALKADTRIYSQGLRNLNDGVSALNIADGALSNLSSIVIRMQELAEQSANGAVGWKQRKSLDAEAQALAKEYFRIARTTNFNGLRLFDGSIQGLCIQAGYGEAGTIGSSLGGDIGTGSFSSVSTQYTTEPSSSRALAISDLNGDGVLDMVTAGSGAGGKRVTVRLGIGDGKFSSSFTQYTAETTQSTALALGDLNGDGVQDLVTAGTDTGGKASVRLGIGDGTFTSIVGRYDTEEATSTSLRLSDLNGDGILDMVTAGIAGFNVGQATIRLGKGDGTFSSISTHYDTEIKDTYGLAVADVNGDGALDMITAGWDGFAGQSTLRLGLGDGSFASSFTRYTTEAVQSFAVAVSDLNGDGALDLVTAGKGAAGQATVRLGLGDGTISSSFTQYATEVTQSYALAIGDLNGDGVPDMVTGGSGAAGKKVTVFQGTGDGSFSSSFQYSGETMVRSIALSDINSDGVSDLVTAGSGGAMNSTVRLATTRDGVGPLPSFDLSTMAGARQAISIFRQKVDQLSSQRGEIGAFQARIASALNTVRVSSENFASAASRIADADIAHESAGLVRTRILQQAAAAVLAQANEQPALAVRLLQE